MTWYTSVRGREASAIAALHRHVTPSHLERPSDSSSLLVEFIGMPGAGKTTLARATLAHLAALGLNACGAAEPEDVVRRRYVGKSAIGTAARLVPDLLGHPQWSLRLWSPIASVRLKGRFARRIVRITHRVRALRHTRAQIIVPDEWVLHELVLALQEPHATPEATIAALVHAVLSRLYLPLLVVHCDIEPAAAALRVSTRTGASEYDRQSVAELLPVFERVDRVVRQLVHHLGEAGVPLMTLSTKEPRGDLPTVVARAIAGRIASDSIGTCAATGKAAQ